MKELFIKDILKTTGGQLIIGNEEDICVDFSKDTREIKKDDTYIGMKGEKFNGSLFWKEALEKGAKTVVVEEIDFEKENLEAYQNTRKNIILVKDTKKALQDIARYKRDLCGKNFKLVGVTGSVGKTSTKDMIANVLSQKYNTLKTEENYNNDIGLPFTLLKLKHQEVAVIEMGMNHLGEISLLTNIAKPTISVITNIGTSHVGNLGSRENILKAKLEILDGMKKPKIVINQDNDLLQKWQKENRDKIQIHTYGIENSSEVMAKNIILKQNYSEFDCIIKEESIRIKIPVGGIHFVYNAMCAALVGNLLGISNEGIKNGIESFSLTKKRMEITDLKNGVKVINDAYNASFESMQVALGNLAEYKEYRKVAVLGDMFELGDYTEELHRKVGQEVVKNKIDLLICVGESAKFIVEEAQKDKKIAERIYYFSNKEQTLKFLLANTKKSDVILFKASNGMKFFEIANAYISEIQKNEKNVNS